MKHTEVLILKREARRSGGDRYENDKGNFVIYVPQHISRPEGIHLQPLSEIKITFEPHEKDEEDNT